MNPAGRTLSYGEQKNLEAKIQEIEDALGSKELVQGVNMNTPNRQKNVQELKRLKGILASQGVSQVSDKEKKDYEKEEELLRQDLQKGMPSWDKYQGSRPKDGPRHDKVVDWVVRSNEDIVRQQKIRRWKTLRRHIDPSNPKAAHVMHLFPD